MLEIFFHLQDFIFTLTLAMVRMGAFLSTFPLMGKALNQSLRQSIMISLSLILIPFLYPTVSPLQSSSGLVLAGIFIKEAFIGFLIAFVAGIPFWSVEGMGFLIDNQRGSSMASLMNISSGEQTTPLGVFLSQVLIALFFSTGGFLMILHMLFQSYILWPISSFIPKVNFLLPKFFLNSMDQMHDLIVTLAAPIVICLFFAEFGLGMMNRFAQQLNVFSLAMPVKSGVSALLLVIYIRFLLHYFDKELLKLPHVLDLLKPIIS